MTRMIPGAGSEDFGDPWEDYWAPSPPPPPPSPVEAVEEEVEEEPEEGYEGTGWQSWLDILNNQFFPEWAKGGYGYDPDWVRLQQTQGEDLINEWANRATEQANLNLVGTGRFYSPGPRQGFYRDIEEERLSQTQDLSSDIATQQLESQFAGRQAWINSLLGLISGQQQYDVGMAGISAGEQAAFLSALIAMLGMT